MTTCKDCKAQGLVNNRAATPPGPRCATHHRERRRAISEAAHGRSIEQKYGITKEQYAKLYVAQGGKCYICRRANGRTKRLAVDHNHETGQVRGLLCRRCNYDLLGHYDIDALTRAITYLATEPGRGVLE